MRTYVLHQQLLRHLAGPPSSVLDVGGGAAHQSLPLARLGHHVTVLDPSASMLEKAEQRLAAEPADVRSRVRLVQATGEAAPDATGGQRFSAVLCHGVLMYQAGPERLLDALCHCVEPGGVVSIMALNAATMAVRPALDHRWVDALAAFDATDEIGVWLFTDWTDVPLEGTDVEAVAAVELEASLREPYRSMSRVFHLVGRDVTPGR